MNAAVRIRITWPNGSLTARLEDTATARALLAALPVESSASTWGEEVYFGVPVKSLLEADARDVVDPGTVCFWVQGSSLALPFGPTPVSRSSECRLVTRVNVLGAIEGDARRLKTVRDGDAVKVERLQG
ncbi:MAG TPA: cyclophilin-like fold protein [Burkholderiales bacterium]|nr:cyclophilin-like fold protein [Burkholderiales bacterium]